MATTERARLGRTLAGAVLAALAVHVAVRLWMIAQGRMFACEDDAYRVYQAHLVAVAPAELIGKIWLPGHFLAIAPLLMLGVPPVWAGVVVSTLGLVGLVAAMTALLRRFALPGAVTAATILILASPMALTLSQSSLAELPCLALLVAGAAGLARRHEGGGRGGLVLAALAFGIATWFRYEAWPVCALASLAAVVLARRRGAGWRGALGDGAVVALSAIGPLLWMGLEWQRYGDPFIFVREADAVARAGGDVGALGVAAARAAALAAWSPAVVAWALVGAALGRGGARVAAICVAAALALPLVPEIASGHDHPVFPARLIFTVEIGLIPLATLGVASALAARPRLAVIGLLATIALAPLAAVRPPAIMDLASNQLAHRLVAREFDVALGNGSLLVERPEQRPPMGWAQVGVAWGQWSRTMWGTPGASWSIVGAADPVHDRAAIPADDLAGWLTRRNVRAAWLVSAGATTTFSRLWPTARQIPIDDGVLFLSGDGVSAGR